MRPVSEFSDRHLHIHIHIPDVERIVIREHHLLRAVTAERGFVVPANDRERVEDVGGVILGQAVELKVERVQADAGGGAPFGLRSLVEIPIGGPRG